MDENNNQENINKENINNEGIHQTVVKPESTKFGSNGDNSFKSIVTNSNTSYSSFQEKKDKKSSNGNGFVKTVLLPFTCGVLGAGIVVGTCFGVPSIREGILGTQASAFGESNTSTTINPNTEQISLLDYSDTAVGVAKKYYHQLLVLM